MSWSVSWDTQVTTSLQNPRGIFQPRPTQAPTIYLLTMSSSLDNVVTNPETNFIYAVGAAPRTDKCKAGIIFIDISDPSNPTSPGW
jgi:hypothetical protein